MSSVQEMGRTQDLGHSFFYYNDLPRPLNSFFFSWNCSFEFGIRKKSIMLTKYHVVLLKASSCGCKIVFFTLTTLV